MTTWQHEVAALHAKLDHILVILADPVVPLQYEEPWPTEAGGWWWVMDTREGGFVGIIMRAEKLGDEIIMRYGGSSYHKKDLDQFWSFAGPITQMPKEE